MMDEVLVVQCDCVRKQFNPHVAGIEKPSVFVIMHTFHLLKKHGI
jgi:hypothetical protein